MKNALSLITPSSHSGFTLIEMMVTIAIVAILAAIAIPSYRQYTVRNAESQALAKMKQLEVELNAWRATALTYRGFYPRQVDSSGNISYAYANNGTNKTIYVPNSATAKYTIILTADSAGTTTLATSLSSSPTATTVNLGSTWFMYATPNNTLSSYGAKKILMVSNGRGCKSSASSFDSTSSCNSSDTVDLTK